MVYYPDDLKDMDGQTVLTELFGQAPETSYWISLDREDDKSFRWNDKRLGIDWRATNGYLVGLHEVTTIEEANEFIKKNRMFFLRMVAFILEEKELPSCSFDALVFPHLWRKKARKIFLE